jgi:hypothetical protein
MIADYRIARSILAAYRYPGTEELAAADVTDGVMAW